MSETTKLTPADAELLWCIVKQISKSKLNELVEWDVIGTQLGDLSNAAVDKRFSRLKIKMRENSEVGDTGAASKYVTEEVTIGGEAGVDGQKAATKETGVEKVATKRSRKTPVKDKGFTGKGKGAKGAKGRTTWESVKDGLDD
ncbi:hypothetical protein SBOR_8176 [Sclerotinia borealis F-4128]|uniref:Myb-like DNA-binding domain-containing protein n=1 Tax=Sclerotinia borealis (strain F-4128) TaxID=1432307 RepID=W9C6U6_SCLBF|nr:hypothetical protein SBOR_8176 [Sclerotinia borealis F-4128]